MIQSTFQLTLKDKLLHWEFNQQEASFALLFAKGTLLGMDVNGEELWQYTLDFTPITFRIIPEGSLIFVLGEGILQIINFRTKKVKTVQIDKHATLLECYKNKALIAGHSEKIYLYTPDGTLANTLIFDFIIRQVKTIPLADSLLIYDQHKRLLGVDISGNIHWESRKYLLDGELLVGSRAYNCIFKKHPDGLVQVEVPTGLVSEIQEQIPLNLVGISANGKYLFSLDIDNHLNIYKQDIELLSHIDLQKAYSHITLSNCSRYFLAIDDDHILSCYRADKVSAREMSSFLELESDQGIIDKRTKWSLSPGSHMVLSPLQRMTANEHGYNVAIQGFDNKVYFIDQRGHMLAHHLLPSMVEGISLCDDGTQGSIFGHGQIVLLNFSTGNKNLISLPGVRYFPPVVDFHRQLIYASSPEGRLDVFNNSGEKIFSQKLLSIFKQGFFSSTFGSIWFNENHILAYKLGNADFISMSVKEEISELICLNDSIIAVTRDGTLITIDIDKKKGIKRKLKNIQGPVDRLLTHPLSIIDAKNTLYLLNKNRRIGSTKKVRAVQSHFYMENNQLYEITRQNNGFSCYNERGDMVWRFKTDQEIKNSALTKNGLCFYDFESVHYLNFTSTEDSDKHYSDFLEW